MAVTSMEADKLPPPAKKKKGKGKPVPTKSRPGTLMPPMAPVKNK